MTSTGTAPKVELVVIDRSLYLYKILIQECRKSSFEYAAEDIETISKLYATSDSL